MAALPAEDHGETCRPNGDRRGHDRGYIDQDALVIIEGQPPIACRVTDLSLSGARLITSQPIETPRTFHLYLPSHGNAFPARVWRHEGAEIGVIFTNGPQHTNNGA